MLAREVCGALGLYYLSAQIIRVVSQIYREQNNRRDVSQSENIDVTITDKTDWTIPILLFNWFLRCCDLKWQREVPLNETFAGLLVKLKLFFKK